MTDRPTPEFVALDAAVAGRYLLERELGRGGMGIVFLAREVALERPVAIKLLPPQLATPELVARFLQEARTAARLAHPHIVPIHAVEQIGDLVFFVMGYIPGMTLAERVRDHGLLAAPEVARLLQEVAWALAHAHQHGVVHRDVKPENILLERGTGRALVTDFGIARLQERTPGSGSERIMGTARVVSPEQAAGEPGDGRSDLYSLGVTAYYALTGRYPFDALDPRAVLTQHIMLPAPPVLSARPGIPPALAAAIDRCLAKSPEGRFATAADLADAVAPVREGSATPSTLQRITREISAFAVDLSGYGSLAFVAIVTQLLRGSDFLGMGFVYTFAVALVLLSLTALRGMSLSRLVREAVNEGWTERDLAAAIEREARTAAATSAPPRPGRAASTAMVAAGLAALVAFWLGPKELGQVSLEGPLAWLIELVSLIAPVALGRWFGTRIEAPRDGRPGLFSRLVARFKLKGFFWAARLASRRPALPLSTGTDRHTEVLIADAARNILRALPDPERRLGGVEQLLSRLEGDAAGLRARLAELDTIVAQVGGAASAQRDELVRDLESARRAATERLGTTVSAMETLRLELLRKRAGLETAGGLTGDLAALNDFAAQVDAEMELRKERLG
jgi:serine/threonine-protein kinase